MKSALHRTKQSPGNLVTGTNSKAVGGTMMFDPTAIWLPCGPIDWWYFI
jgi:hypothetical protein